MTKQSINFAKKTVWPKFEKNPTCQKMSMKRSICGTFLIVFIDIIGNVFRFYWQYSVNIKIEIFIDRCAIFIDNFDKFYGIFWQILWTVLNILLNFLKSLLIGSSFLFTVLSICSHFVKIIDRSIMSQNNRKKNVKQFLHSFCLKQIFP